MSLDIEEHMTLFAEAFVQKERSERWRGFLTRHTRKMYARSSDLYNHLDERYFRQDDELDGVTSDETVGVFYNFMEKPKCITFAEAVELGSNNDAIFSIKPGKLAIYFFHEGWNYVCSK